ncbi:MAG: ArnT family glycosyltransferase [Cytophagaceae bacterium]
MSRKIQLVFFAFFAAYLLLHLITLSYNPLPWFDETYFASICQSFMEKGSFVPQVAWHAREGKEALTYGPVYFLLTGLSVKFFGLGIFQFRIVNFLCGLGCIWICFKILQKKELGISALLFLACFALDPFFNLSMHEGRMDLTATFFALLSLHFILKDGMKNIIFSSVTASLSLMTTPRSALLVAGVVMLMLIKAYKDDQYRPLIVWGLSFLCLYAVWLFYAFGSPAGYFNYYTALQGNENGVNHDFLGGRFYIPRQEYVLIIVAAFSLIYRLIKRQAGFPDQLISVSIAVILLFYVIVLDWGPYSALIIPFYYMIVFREEYFSWSFRNPMLYMVAILLTHNLCYSTLKSADVLSSANQRNPKIADQFIADHIPPGSKVVGDALYYYSVKRAGSDYQYFDKYASPEVRERRHREEYDYDYLILTEQSLKRDGETVHLYLENSRLTKIAELHINPSALNQKIASLGLISNTENNGYNASIYARLKEHQAPPMAADFGLMNKPH